MDPAPRLSTDISLTPGASGGQEIVSVTTWFSTPFKGSRTLESTVVRRFVSALDGTGLEADLCDPVTLMSIPIDTGVTPEISVFHARALRELEARRRVDYEIADLFVLEP